MTPHDEISSILQAHGIQPSAQRVAIALFVLRTDAHPTADEVLRWWSPVNYLRRTVLEPVEPPADVPGAEPPPEPSLADSPPPA